MATATDLITLPVVGMTCEGCAATVRKALESVPGVQSATVDLSAKLAEVVPGPAGVERGALRAAIESAGYSSPDELPRSAPPPGPLLQIGSAPKQDSAPETEEWDLAVGGMHCASCVARVENALTSVP